MSTLLRLCVYPSGNSCPKRNIFTLQLMALVCAIIWILVCSFLLKNVNALEQPYVFQYYQRTKYTEAKLLSPYAPSHFVSALPTEKSPTIFPNKLSANDADVKVAEADTMPPNNPAPMLHPNPFVNKAGLKIQFAGKKKLPDRIPSELKAPLLRDEGSFCRRSFDGRSGYCVLAYHCLHVMRDYRVHGTKIDVCTYRRNIPVVCCPLKDKHSEEQRISAKKCLEYHDSLRGIRLGIPRVFSGKLCVPSVPLIVGGEVTNAGDYPHMAALGWTQSENDIKWGCGGTLISEVFVLTAAHCATSGENPPNLVRLGTSSLKSNTSGKQDIRISIIILHPKYRTALYYHDIALLKLADRAHFSHLVRPACLWQTRDMDIRTAVAAGWGRTEFLGSKSDDLRKVDLNLIDQRFCKQLYRRERRLPRGIIDAQFCAGRLEGGKDTCQGDSGGPLHAELPEFKCVKFVVGITSFGKFCAANNSPGVYTKIYAYLDWIERIVFPN